jgi:hypothetical protein
VQRLRQQRMHAGSMYSRRRSHSRLSLLLMMMTMMMLMLLMLLLLMIIVMTMMMLKATQLQFRALVGLAEDEHGVAEHNLRRGASWRQDEVHATLMYY